MGVRCRNRIRMTHTEKKRFQEKVADRRIQQWCAVKRETAKKDALV